MLNLSQIDEQPFQMPGTSMAYQSLSILELAHSVITFNYLWEKQLSHSSLPSYHKEVG